MVRNKCKMSSNINNSASFSCFDCLRILRKCWQNWSTSSFSSKAAEIEKKKWISWFEIKNLNKRCISFIKDIKKLTLPVRNNAQLKETPHNFSLFVRKRRLMSNSRNQTHRQAKKFLFSFIALEPTCNTGNLRVESLRVNNNFFLTESAGSIGEYWLREVAVRIERSEVRARTTESQCS